jgi:hypothetical protein
LRKRLGLKDKEEVSKALKDSFAYCAEALKGMDDQKSGGDQQRAVSVIEC